MRNRREIGARRFWEGRKWPHLLRRSGPVLVGIGVAFSIAAVIEFLATFGIFQPLRLAWCWAVGMPLLFVGLVFCHLRVSS